MKRKEPSRLTVDMMLNAFRSAYGDDVHRRLVESHFIAEIWPEVLGQLNQYTSVMKIEDGTLYVRVLSAPLRNDLFMQRSTLIARLNEAAGSRVIHSIMFR